MQFFVVSKYRLRPNGRKKEKLSNRLTVAILKDLSFRKYRVQQISAHICDRGGGVVEANSFLPEKITVSPFHSSALHVFVFVG